MKLDVQFSPAVRLEREGGPEVEAGVDSLTLSCRAHGNPRPDVVWRKLGQNSIFSLGEELSFQPVRRGDGGTYICMARNSVGASEEVSAGVAVVFPAERVTTDPESLLDLVVGEGASLSCQAAASPEPRYEWWQRQAGPAAAPVLRARGPALRLSNASYEDEGMWSCAVVNKIKGEERRVASPAVRVGVRGAPRQRQGVRPGTVTVSSGEAARLVVEFCADPPPRQLVWQWGSLTLSRDSSRGRFRAGPLERMGPPHCYLTWLQIRGVSGSDQVTQTFFYSYLIW